MADDGPRREGQGNGGDAAGLAEGVVTYRVHPGEHPAQPADAQPMVDCAVRHPEIVKLAPGHHAVLARRQPRDLLIVAASTTLV